MPVLEEEAAQAPSPSNPQPAEQDLTFEIVEFELEGNAIFPAEKLLELLVDLVGAGRTAEDVEKARDILEKFYHEQGYPTVLVNIPEQTVGNGIIRLQVIESRIGSCRVKGNRYFTTEQIMRKLPSLAPGVFLYIPDVQKDLARINRNPDLKVVPSMIPGMKPGTVDVELKVEDRYPFHGNLELNNRASHNTSDLRLNAALHYDNLWNRMHSLTLQYQTAPEKPSEVQVFSGTYMLPDPWNDDNNIVVYGVLSDSDTAFGEGFRTQGNGSIIGTRYLIPLPPHESYGHTLVAGIDYKNFDETTGSADSSAGDIKTPVEYLPFTFSYSGYLPDSGGLTLFNASLNGAFRGLVSREQEFRDKRFKGRENYLFATLGVERRQKLPAGMGFMQKLDGQITGQPLISNEQSSAGGMDSVRGYKESEGAGDSAFHGVTELSAPDMAPMIGLGDRHQITPYLFYDFALLWVKDPLPSQDKLINLQGTGIGVRGYLFRNLEFQADWAYALSDTGRIGAGDSRLHFRATYQF